MFVLACEKITENLYVAANEPTLACYQIQEHVHKSVPLLINKNVKETIFKEKIYFIFFFSQIEMNKNETILKGMLYDIEYSHSSLKSIEDSQPRFDSIQRILKDSIYFKQQIDYNECVKKRVQERIQQQQCKDHSDLFEDSVQNVKKRKNPLGKGFNRFSASFDFPTSFPVVASSVSADLKSLINQFTHSNINSHKTNSTQPSIVSSNSLHVLTENSETLNEHNDDNEEK